MTDRERASAFLESTGFRRLPERSSTSWAPSVWFDRDRGGIRENVVVDAYGEVVYRASARISDLPALLSPLTLETVEQIIDDVEWDLRESDMDPETLSGALDAIEKIKERLRQQMGGGQ